MRINCDIEVNQNTVSVVSDYHAGFISVAKRLGGRWENPAWVFDARDVDEVKSLCQEYYGWSEDGTAELVDIEIHWPDGASIWQDSIVYSGVTIARARGRDSGAHVADNIKILSGGFGSGGSMKNWRTTAKEDTRILLRDMPKSLYVKDSNDSDNGYIAKIVNQAVDIDALKAEKERLLKRIDEISKTIGAAE